MRKSKCQGLYVYQVAKPTSRSYMTSVSTMLRGVPRRQRLLGRVSARSSSPPSCLIHSILQVDPLRSRLRVGLQKAALPHGAAWSALLRAVENTCGQAPPPEIWGLNEGHFYTQQTSHSLGLNSTVSSSKQLSRILWVFGGLNASTALDSVPTK
ncbi:hypothetical protein H1C71_035280 [Ictidomys tridecemlineatus]|nr:hypothetical protein H1C71_035280 [Ictidomys tridecemlineatus]